METSASPLAWPPSSPASRAMGPSTDGTPIASVSPRASFSSTAVSKANSISSIEVDGLISPSQSSLCSSPCASLAHTRAPTRAGSVCSGPAYSRDDSRKASLAMSSRHTSMSNMFVSSSPACGCGSGAWCGLGAMVLGPASPVQPPFSSREPSRPSSAATVLSSSAAASMAGALKPPSDISSDEDEAFLASVAASGAHAGRTAASCGARQPLRPASARRPYTPADAAATSGTPPPRPPPVIVAADSAAAATVLAAEAASLPLVSATQRLTLSAAEEAKRSASDTARRIAMAAAECPATSAGPLGANRVAPPTGSPARAFASRSLNAPTSTGPPSAAEIAKRRAEDAAREMARSALESAAPKPSCGAWELSSGASGGGGGCSLGPATSSSAAEQSPPRTEAEAIKHRASAFAKELADRVERETTQQRRSAGGPLPSGQRPRGGAAATGLAAASKGSATAASSARASSVAQSAPASGRIAKPTAAAAGATDAAPVAVEPKRSARALGRKALLMTLLKPEHRRSAQVQREPSGRRVGVGY